tara:strand:+ start:1433 stop:1903 length:471 start_codon:yes stop_codon:yes gene_type:complete
VAVCWVKKVELKNKMPSKKQRSKNKKTQPKSNGYDAFSKIYEETQLKAVEGFLKKENMEYTEESLFNMKYSIICSNMFMRAFPKYEIKCNPDKQSGMFDILREGGVEVVDGSFVISVVDKRNKVKHQYYCKCDGGMLPIISESVALGLPKFPPHTH